MARESTNQDGLDGEGKGKNKKQDTDKEYQAVALNLREDRGLQRAMQTLSLEQTYAMKLLDLDHRQIQLRHKRMKTRVTKIQSYLEPGEIIEMRRLELAGKLKPERPGLKVSSAIRIAAAARRLNLGSEKRRALAEQKRRKEREMHQKQMELHMKEQLDQAAQKIRPTSSHSSAWGRQVMLPLRPATSNGFTSHRDSNVRRVKSALLYSSHKGAKPSDASRQRASSAHRRRDSSASEVSLGSNAAKNMLENEIEQLLAEEDLKTTTLQNRKHDFVDRIEDWVSENPSVAKDSEFEVSLESALLSSGDVTRDDITSRALDAQKRHEANMKAKLRRQQFGCGIRKMTLISTAWGLPNSDDGPKTSGFMKHKQSASDDVTDDDLKPYEFLLTYEDRASKLSRISSAKSRPIHTP